MPRPNDFPIRTCISIDAYHLAKLREMAKSRGCSVSALIRILIDDYANAMELLKLADSEFTTTELE